MTTTSDRALKTTSRRGFTLIEMLVVIAIIGVLASMLLAGISAVRSHARKVVAKTEVTQMAAAWKHYYSEYNRWPSIVASEDAEPISDDLLGILRGEIGIDNPRRVPFSQFNRVNADNTPISPWGHPDFADADTPENAFYYVMMDVDFNNVIEAPPGATLEGRTWDEPLHTNVAESVIVWTVNEDLDPEDEEYIIGSWTP